MASSLLRFLDHTQRRITFGRTPLDKWSVRRRDLYLTTHNTHSRKTYMPPKGIEPAISAGERPQTYALDRAATGTGMYFAYNISSIWINQTTMRSHWEFRTCTCTNDHTLYSFPHYKFLWPEDGPQWPKHVVASIKNSIQRKLCFDVPTPSYLHKTQRGWCS